MNTEVDFKDKYKLGRYMLTISASNYTGLPEPYTVEKLQKMGLDDVAQYEHFFYACSNLNDMLVDVTEAQAHIAIVGFCVSDLDIPMTTVKEMYKRYHHLRVTLGMSISAYKKMVLVREYVKALNEVFSVVYFDELYDELSEPIRDMNEGFNRYNRKLKALSETSKPHQYLPVIEKSNKLLLVSDYREIIDSIKDIEYKIVPSIRLPYGEYLRQYISRIRIKLVNTQEYKMNRSQYD